MKKNSRNPYSGRNSSGFRFRFHIPSISRLPLFLPIEMKELPQINILLEGGSPLEAFGVDSLDTARMLFRCIRKRYDFDYWAVKEFFVRDINDPDRIIPLHLNDRQIFAIDIIRRRYFLRRDGRYIISKTGSRCGLTTCIQAYIFWLRNINSGNSITWSVGDELSSLKSTLHLNIHIPAYSSDTEVYVPDAQSYAFLFPYNKYDISRNSCRLVDYVHLSDMSKWDDKRCEYSIPLYVHSLDIIHESPHSLCVMEGDLPDPSGFSLTWWRNYFRNNGFQMALLDRFKVNPLLVNKIISQYSSLFHIDLDQYLS